LTNYFAIFFWQKSSPTFEHHNIENKTAPISLDSKKDLALNGVNAFVGTNQYPRCYHNKN
jgi:hypothetical protein